MLYNKFINGYSFDITNNTGTEDFMIALLINSLLVLTSLPYSDSPFRFHFNPSVFIHVFPKIGRIPQYFHSGLTTSASFLITNAMFESLRIKICLCECLS